MANQIVNVLASIIETINNHEDASLDRAKQIAQAIMQLQSSVDELAERISKLEVKPAAIDTDISSDDAAKLLGMMKGKSTEATEDEEESEDDDIEAQLKTALEENEKTRKLAAKSKPEPKPEEEDEEIDEEDEEEALDNVANPDETKSIFQSKSTGRQRIICMNYLKQAGRKSECRMPDKLTWDYCSTIKADESSSKSAIQQWLEFVVAYEQSNG